MVLQIMSNFDGFWLKLEKMVNKIMQEEI